MKKLKVTYLFLVCILCNIIGCYLLDDCAFATDCGIDDEKLPAYANESGVMVKIVAINSSNGYVHNYATFIDVGDTLHYFKKPEEWDIPHRWNCGIAYMKGCSNPTRIELHFLDEPQRCLIFDGPIEHNGIDMRSWGSYKRGNIIPDPDDWWANVEYVYTITTKHRAMAKEQHCPVED